MILKGITNGKKVVASLSAHHYATHDELMMDGGNPLTNHYAGYSRYSMEGEHVWFEVPEIFEELYDAWNHHKHGGVWDIEDVEIIPEEKWDKIDMFQEKVNNFLWGTYGKDGNESFKRVSLKNCTKDHLENIIKNVPRIEEDTRLVIEYLINHKS